MSARYSKTALRKEHSRGLDLNILFDLEDMEDRGLDVAADLERAHARRCDGTDLLGLCPVCADAATKKEEAA